MAGRGATCGRTGPCRVGRPLWQGRAVQGGAPLAAGQGDPVAGWAGGWTAVPQLSPLLPGLQTWAQADFLPVRGGSCGHLSLYSRNSSPCNPSTSTSRAAARPQPCRSRPHPRHVLSCCFHLPVRYVSATVWGFSRLCLEGLGARSPHAPGFPPASSWACPCTSTAGETEAGTRGGSGAGNLPAGSPEDTHGRQGHALRMAWRTRWEREDARRVHPGTQEDSLGEASTSASLIRERCGPNAHTPTAVGEAVGLDTPRPRKEPLLAFLAVRWVCHHLLARADIWHSRHQPCLEKRPSREELRGNRCSRPFQAPGALSKPRPLSPECLTALQVGPSGWTAPPPPHTGLALLAPAARA